MRRRADGLNDDLEFASSRFDSLVGIGADKASDALAALGRLLELLDVDAGAVFMLANNPDVLAELAIGDGPLTQVIAEAKNVVQYFAAVDANLDELALAHDEMVELEEQYYSRERRNKEVMEQPEAVDYMRVQSKYRRWGE